MSTPTGDRLARLARAVEVFLEHRSSGGIGKDLLESHADLRDLLEPMIADDSVASATITAGAAGRVLGDFRLIREIGRGGMGVVYEAHQLSLDRRVAVKLLSGSLALRPDSVARFKREALAAGKLRHPGIVEVYAVGSDGDTHWFAMELVEGGPLRPGPDRRAAVSRCALVAAALQHAHEHGVVHRDVKPSNVLYRERDGRVVLTDFGLACLEDQPQITATGALAGTPSYLAPEQLLGEAVDHRADVYALGATLYELLTGHPPFEGETSAVVLHRILTQEPEDPRRHVPDLDADLAAVVLKTLEKKPEDRYPTAGALGL
jgi:serine/threonine protein kinase